MSQHRLIFCCREAVDASRRNLACRPILIHALLFQKSWRNSAQQAVATAIRWNDRSLRWYRRTRCIFVGSKRTRAKTIRWSSTLPYWISFGYPLSCADDILCLPGWREYCILPETFPSFPGVGGLSSGKMKFLVQFAIRRECKRPSPYFSIYRKKSATGRTGKG